MGGVLLVATACRPSALERASQVDTTPVTREGRVVLHCDPTDAEVALDGVPVGLCSDYAGDERGLSTGPGDHTLEFRKRGHFGYRTVVAPDRAQAVVQVRLTPNDSGSVSQ